MTGSNNTYLGNSADATTSALNNSTAVGYNAKVSASNQIVLGTATEYVSIPSTTVSTTTATGAIVVAGGVGIGGNVNIGGNLNVSSTTASFGSSSGALLISGNSSTTSNN